MRTTKKRNLDQYQFTVRPLSKEEVWWSIQIYPDACQTAKRLKRRSRMAAKLSGIVWRCSGNQAERYQSSASKPLNSLVAAIIAEAIGAKRAR